MCQLTQIRTDAYSLSGAQFGQGDGEGGEGHVERFLPAQNSGWDISVAEVEDVGSEDQPALFGIERVDFGVRRSQSIPRFVQARSYKVVCMFLRSREFVGQAWDFVREEDWSPAVDDWPAVFPLDAGDGSLSA
jgi:hypothetical protein